MASGIGKKIDKFLDGRTESKEEKHRLTVFLLGTGSGLVAYPLHFIGVWGSPDHVLLSLSVAIWLGLLAAVTLFIYKKISLLHAFYMYGIVMQTCLTAKILYISITMPPGSTYLIIFNSFISMIVILFLVMGYMHTLPFCLTIASLATSIAAYVIRPGVIQAQFIMFFFFVEIISCALGYMMWRALHDTEKENKDFREEENDILKAFNMTREELMAYISMSKTANQSKKDVSEFFEHLDERTEHNIINAVKQRETEVRMQNADVSKAFPMLSPTEVGVCRLILQGKTIKEIGTLLGKTTNNISAVRIHIRKKLGLTTDQDLREYLMKRVSQGK